MHRKKIYLCVLFLLVLVFNCYSQTANPSPPVKKLDSSVQVANPPAPRNIVVKDNYGFLSSYEFILSISILVFGLLLILFELHLIKTNQIAHDHAIKFIIITLIIVSTLFLITAGYNNDQIAPATGLLGTIAGYLLGRTTKSENNNE